LSPRRLTIAALLVSVSLAAPVNADTLRDALVSAYETNPSLTAAREGQKATNEGVPLAKANGRPDVTVQPTYFENIMQDGGSSVTQARGVSVSGTLSAPLYAGGGIKNAIRAAENRVEAGFANLRGTESAIFSAVVGAYMDVIRDEAIVELNRAQVGVLSVNLEATRDRFEIGDLTRTDVAQSEARLALQTSSLEQARANLIRSKEVYIQLVGREPGQLEAPPPLPNLPDTPDNAVNVALDSNPDLIAARENREAADSERFHLAIVQQRAQFNFVEYSGVSGG
jgi:outer membrane protein